LVIRAVGKALAADALKCVVGAFRIFDAELGVVIPLDC
jgi:hypothetical protein